MNKNAYFLKNIVVGYYPVWFYPNILKVDDIDFSALTHIAVAFISTYRKDLNKYSQIIKQIIDKTYLTNVRVIASVGGGNKKETQNIRNIVSDKNNRQQFIKWLSDYVVENNIDGLDIDWEFPESKKDSENYVKLIRELRCILNKKGKNKFNEPYYLSIACPGIDFFGRWFDIKKMYQYLDYLHIMTYDYYGFYSDLAGHNSPLFFGFDGLSKDYIDWSMKYWEKEKGVDKSKLLSGLSFYGRRFDKVKKLYDKNTPSDKENAVSYRDIKKFYNKNGWQEIFDKKRYVPYKINRKKQIIITFDNKLSISKKCDYVIKNNYKGVIIWALGQDKINGKQELLSIVKNKFKGEKIAIG